MYLLHYIIPFIIFYFFKDKIILFGLLLGNFVDLDHIYFRIIGKIGWFESACRRFGMQCSFGFYPLHNWIFFIAFLLLSSLIFVKNKKFKFAGWIFLGASIHLILDYVHFLIGFGI